MPNETNPLNDSINGIKNFQEHLNQATEETEDVKNGDCTAEDERQEPAYKLFNAIAETSVAVMQMPLIQELFEKIKPDIGEEFAKDMTELITVVMTNSAYAAISFYDDLLKDELQAHFQNVGETFNALGADVNAHTGALEIHKNRIDKLERCIEDMKVWLNI